MLNKLLCLLLAAGISAGATACGQAAQDVPPENGGTGAATAYDPLPEPEPVPDPAETYVDGLSLEEQAAQMFFARCPETEAAALAGQYNIGGYILFGRDFEGQTPDSVRDTIASYQQAAKTPMLIGVDEEGGTVVRVSANPNFRSSRFASPRQLYTAGGMERVLSDTAEKDELLASIGVNVNLAPVCDFTADPGDFMYARSFGDAPEQTADYAAQVVAQMKEDGMGMVLKHFPGYGNNVDTHTGIAVDERPMEQFRRQDFLPFQAGAQAGADAVLVNHNVVNCMDAALPASLSPAVHQVLRDELGFDGVVMTDDLIMDAITQYTGGEDAAVLAVLAGNDMLISSDFVTQYNAVLAAVRDGRVSPDAVRAAALRVVRWKMALGLLPQS